MEENNYNAYSETLSEVPETPEVKQNYYMIKKPFYRKWQFWTIVALVIAILISGTFLIRQHQELEEIKAIQAAEEAAKAAEEAAKAADKRDPGGYMVMVQAALQTNEDIIYDYVGFTTEEGKDVVTVKVHMPTLTDLISMCRMYNYIPDAYYDFLDMTRQVCLSLQEKGKEFGYDNLICNFVVLDSKNRSKELIATKNGVVIHEPLGAIN